MYFNLVWHKALQVEHPRRKSDLNLVQGLKYGASKRRQNLQHSNNDRLVLQCNPDIRELSGPDKKYLISGFIVIIIV